MPCHPLGFQLRLNVIQRIKVFYFTGDAALEFRCIKQRNWADAAAAGQKRFPERFNPDPVRSQNSHAGDDDAIALDHVNEICKGVKKGAPIPKENDLAACDIWKKALDGLGAGG